jgi:hypothetical protein
MEAPGEWAVQGAVVESTSAAGYRRCFTAPESWRGHRVKLRCDGVYSDAKIWINGQEAGAHLGGFTAFELDVTRLVQPGKNLIALSVRSNSIADKLASGIKYGTHDLGGITRKIYLIAVPELNVADVYIRTVFDENYRNAKLIAQVRVANESAKSIEGAGLTLNLRDGTRKVQAAAILLPTINPGVVITQEIALEVTAPRKWDPEHPHLYELACSLTIAGKPAETVARHAGFRQIEVRGNEVYVNGHPIKLRGVNRHEADPLRGRSLLGDIWRKDVELFRAMNCNLIRTSHYPPAQELIDVCDELGMFVEVEAPFCWAPDNNSPDALAYTIQAEIETVLRDRSHPCVLLWSVGNESHPWGRNFEIAHRDFMRPLDSSRPYLFEISSGDDLQQNPPLDIDVLHYPGFAGPGLAAQNPRPVFFGEFAHLNSYNRSELLTDPGLRDVWGLGVAQMWEKMLASRGCLGGAIWSGVDDLFIMPDGGAVGYGDWAPLDAWRRPRPEYWHLKKTFSPVRIDENSIAHCGGGISIRVENRQLFSDLSEVRFEWSLGLQRGEATTNGSPGSIGRLLIPVHRSDGETLDLRAIDSRGVLVDEWRFAKAASPECLVSHGTAGFSRTSGIIRISAGGTVFEMDAATGMLASVSNGSTNLDLDGPTLMLLPLRREADSKVSFGGHQNRFLPEPLRQAENSALPRLEPPAPFNVTCSHWQPGSISAREVDGCVEVRIPGKYTEAAGEFTLRFSGDGKLRIEYDFTLNAEISPRQTGLVFRLPAQFDTLAWRRTAQWPFYPDDHIGRPHGRAGAFPTTPALWRRSAPAWSWASDCTPGGSNDFRSTKMNILQAALLDPQGHGMRAISDGRQHVRAWIQENLISLLIADFSNEGASNFFKEQVLPRPTLQPGEHVAGAAIIEIV